MRDYSRVIREGWPSTWTPSAPPFQAAESELVRIDGELAASLTVQFWAIRSRGRLLDLAGQHIESGEHAGASGTASRGARTTSHAPLSYGTLRSPSQAPARPP